MKFGGTDHTYNYIKVIYNFNNFSILDETTLSSVYIQNCIVVLESYQEQYQEIRKFLTKLTDLEVSAFHQENLEIIGSNDVTSFTNDILHPTKAKDFQSILEDFTLSPSSQELS